MSLSSGQELDKNQRNLEILFLEYRKPIYRFVYRFTQDEQLSVDIVQDTFIKFNKYQSNYDEKQSNIKTYLFRIAYQLMVNRIKRRERMKKILPFLNQQLFNSEVTTEDRLTIQWALKMLSKEQRVVIILMYYHDLTQQNISDILEIPLGTVKSRVHHGLLKLRQLMEVEEGE
ncbi:RNA polymerase sigma factor [Aquibacillus kalidii]|uniref:RNA polymerase sigma factor n=1 Tax=Aquibacillus kalidii TaxID=2762597 RepID=UPI00164892B6|nr:RNA polymerase sigma factor [Aquibacillus kalidii]